MADEKRKKILELPMKILFNEEGINFFLKSNKKLTRFKTADDTEQYGIVFDTFSPPSVQKMLLINYIASMEISRPEFMSKRQDVIDLSKLVTYGTLYRRFDEVVFSKVIDSEVTRKWNRVNPSSIIDRKTAVNDGALLQALDKNKLVVSSIKQGMLKNLVESVQANADLAPEEKNVQLFLADKFLSILRPFTWFVLLKFKDSEDLSVLLAEIEAVLQQFMVKARIPEYLSLMTMELTAMAENASIQSFSKNRYKGTLDPIAVQYDPEMRKMIVEEMRVRSQNVALSWKVGGDTVKGASGRERLQVKILNREIAGSDPKKPDDAKAVRARSLPEFYREGGEEAAAANELGLYYLNLLSEECQRVGVHFESLVSQVRESNLTLVTLTLLF